MALNGLTGVEIVRLGWENPQMAGNGMKWQDMAGYG